MKKDIEAGRDIELLVNRFYDKVKTSSVIGYIFNDVAKVNWEKHLPVMYRFWENVIFYTGVYTGNPLLVHKQLDKLFPLAPQHFAEWNILFSSTVDELFEGEKANLAKQRAISISTVIQMEIFKSRQ
ncbi:MAG: group III truncated hemoglobin [Ferruginibacter sp.]